MVLRKYSSILLLVWGTIEFLYPQNEWDTVWTRIYGEGWAIPYSIICDTTDPYNFYYLVGGTIWGEGASDMWVLKLNSETGNAIWARFYGEDSLDERCIDMAVDREGNYIAVGFKRKINFQEDMWILKLNSLNGDILWSKVYGNEGMDIAYSVAIDSQGYYVVVGYGGGSIWILKIDPFTGDTIWSRIHEEGIPKSLVVDPENYYVITGYKSYGNIREDLLVLKVDPITGDTVWKKLYGEYYDDWGEDIVVDNDGYYAVCGYTEVSSNRYQHLWILRIDPSTGDTLWTRRYTKQDTGATAQGISVDGDGNYIIVGTVPPYPMGWGPTSVWVVKFSPEIRDTVWTKSYGGPYTDVGMAVSVDPENHYIIAGVWDPTHNETDGNIWVIKLYGNAAVSNPEKEIHFHYTLFSSKSEIFLKSIDRKLNIYFINGRKMNSVVFNLPAGIYFVERGSKDIKIKKRMLILR